MSKNVNIIEEQIIWYQKEYGKHPNMIYMNDKALIFFNNETGLNLGYGNEYNGVTISEISNFKEMEWEDVRRQVYAADTEVTAIDYVEPAMYNIIVNEEERSLIMNHRFKRESKNGKEN